MWIISGVARYRLNKGIVWVIESAGPTVEIPVRLESPQGTLIQFSPRATTSACAVSLLAEDAGVERSANPHFADGANEVRGLPVGRALLPVSALVRAAMAAWTQA